MIHLFNNFFSRVHLSLINTNPVIISGQNLHELSPADMPSFVLKVNGTNSKVPKMVYGVLQGSLLRPLLYLCYCDDMEMAVNCKLILLVNNSMIVVLHKYHNAQVSLCRIYC